MTTTRSARPSTSGSSDDTRITDSPRVTSSLMKRCTAAFEPMSMPLVGSSRMMTFGFGRQPFAEHDLLLVAARELGHVLGQVAGLEFQLLGEVARDRVSGRAPAAQEEADRDRIGSVMLCMIGSVRWAPWCWRSSGT
jgi:hypothetical protein